MMRKLVLGAVAAVAAAAGLAGGHAGGVPVRSVRPVAPSGCAPLPAFAGGEAPGLATGHGLWAVAGGALVSTTAARSLAPSGADDGSIRHVASAPGRGTAYVVDRAGDDEVVAVTSDGTRRVEAHGEATHPAWSPMGELAWAVGSTIAVLDRDGRHVTRLEGPTPRGTVFSPVYLSASRLAVVASAPPTAAAPEGAWHDDLWVTRPDRSGWRRLTSFHASSDRWVTIRTPVMFEGALHFIRIVGRASATREPRFELWQYEQGTAHRVRDLPGERYLAGSLGGELIWNRPDPANGRFLLAVEGTSGERTIGCGAVTVDPIDVIDPDRRVGQGSHVPARGSWPELEAPTHEDQEEIAVIVGDFAAEAEAEAVVAAIVAAYPGATVGVVDASTAPLAIRPGVHGALLHLPAGADPTGALAEFRDRLPQYASNSWIVTP